MERNCTIDQLHLKIYQLCLETFWYPRKIYQETQQPRAQHHLCDTTEVNLEPLAKVVCIDIEITEKHEETAEGLSTKIDHSVTDDILNKDEKSLIITHSRGVDQILK